MSTTGKINVLPQNFEIERSDSQKSTTVPLFFIFFCTLCMAVLYSNILIYHMTVTQIHSYGNGSVNDFYEVFDYREVNESRINISIHLHRFLSNPQKESLITVSPLGGIIAWFPVAVAYNHMGFRRSFVLCALLCIIPSVFIPICTTAKTFLLSIVIRILQGFSLAAFLPYLCKLSVFLPFNHIAIPSIVFAYIQIAAFFAFPLCSILCWSSFGWHSPHYVVAIGTFLLFFVFLLINYDDEFKDQASRDGLFNALFTYERSRSRILSLNLPYLSIYQDLRVWSIFVAAFGYFTAINLYLTFGPTFLHKVVGMSIVPTGLLLMIPPACNIFTSFFVLGIFPKLANTVPNKLRVFNSLGMVIPGILFMLIGVFDPYTQPASVAALFILASSLLGFVSCGFFKMNQLRSKQYHLFLLANLFLVNCVSMFLTSLFNVLIAKNDEYTTWGAVLILHGAILIVCNIVFCIFASENAADWTKEGFEDTSIHPRREDPLPQRPL